MLQRIQLFTCFKELFISLYIFNTAFVVLFNVFYHLF